MKILIADDHPLFRQGIIQAIELIPNAEIVAQAGDGMEAYHQILYTVPDMVILDLEMPVLNGIELCKKLKQDFSQIKVVILTMHKEKHFFEAAMQVGANGYILKDNAVEDIISCIKTVGSGKDYISPDIKNFLSENHVKSEILHLIDKLTPTESVILKLISEGNTSAEIAKLLFSSPHTVENHRSNMTKKLGLEPEKNALLKFALSVKPFL